MTVSSSEFRRLLRGITTKVWCSTTIGYRYGCISLQKWYSCKRKYRESVSPLCRISLDAVVAVVAIDPS